MRKQLLLLEQSEDSREPLRRLRMILLGFMVEHPEISENASLSYLHMIFIDIWKITTC